MAQWIETKLRYDKLQDSGKMKKVTETYLVDALTFAEAEARIIEEMQPFISGEFSVSAVKKSKVNELFIQGDGDRFYLVKVGFEVLNEKTGQIKLTPAQMLVKAHDLEEALVNFKDEMPLMTVDFQILSITETAIMDVYPIKVSDNN